MLFDRIIEWKHFVSCWFELCDLRRFYKTEITKQIELEKFNLSFFIYSNFHNIHICRIFRIHLFPNIYQANTDALSHPLIFKVHVFSPFWTHLSVIQQLAHRSYFTRPSDFTTMEHAEYIKKSNLQHWKRKCFETRDIYIFLYAHALCPLLWWGGRSRCVILRLYLNK